jgi:hypothetical protein
MIISVHYIKNLSICDIRRSRLPLSARVRWLILAVEEICFLFPAKLAARGYSRDGKCGDPQIVFGLICTPAGRP